MRARAIARGRQVRSKHPRRFAARPHPPLRGTFSHLPVGEGKASTVRTGAADGPRPPYFAAIAMTSTNTSGKAMRASQVARPGVF
jgi:hypothetical protein